VKALVLAAGRSTRLEGLGGGRPKPLLELGGRTLLEWNLRWVLASGFGPVWVNLHHRAGEVREAVASMELGGEPVRFSEEEPILGTAGAWRALAPEWDETSLVVYGDNAMRFDLASFVASHRTATAAGALATVALFDPARHAHTGMAGSRVLVGSDGRVTGFTEIRGDRPGGALVNAGAYLLQPDLAQGVPPGFVDFGADVFPGLVRNGVLQAHVLEDGGFCLGLDTPEHYERGRTLIETGAVVLT
jgi:NDP-sugar pyrophosphorylase family protein